MELINSCNKGIQLDRSRYVGISSLRPFHLHSLFHLPFLIATFCYATSRNMLTQDSLWGLLLEYMRNVQNVRVAHTAGDVVTRVVEEEWETHLIHGAWPSLQRHKDDSEAYWDSKGRQFLLKKALLFTGPADPVWWIKKNLIVCQLEPKNPPGSSIKNLLCNFIT